MRRLFSDSSPSEQLCVIGGENAPKVDKVLLELGERTIHATQRRRRGWTPRGYLQFPLVVNQQSD
jgi:hypothetical protein